MKLGPDASRYWLAGQGRPVARPFHLRWLLPAMCRNDARRWSIVWAASWPVLAAGMVWFASDLGWRRALFASVLVVALPGVRSKVTTPVGVDLPAMALSTVAAAAAVHGWWWLAVPLVLVAAAVKESSPIFAALWAWSWVPLVGLAAVVVAALVRRPELDPVTSAPNLREIHDHPIRTAWTHRRDHGLLASAAVWLHPLGACLIGLYGATGRTLTAVAVAFGQCAVATDTTRLVATGAGPALAVAAAAVLPVEALVLVAAVHVWWPFDRIVA